VDISLNRRSPFVAVAVVDVRPVGVLVDELLVAVAMGMEAPGVVRRIGRIVVVDVVAVIVAMAVLVHLGGMAVEVAVLLGDEQPGAECHERYREQERQVRLLGEEQDGEGNPEERGHG
jgi:hypothetical protein